jgi:hypothetical protein
MQLSELKKRIKPKNRSASFLGDEGLVLDGRSTMKPVECVDRKLRSLLSVGSSVTELLRRTPR